MRLRRFELENVGPTRRVSVTFQDSGPNLIVAPDERWKGHLMQTFYGVLFGLEHPEQLKPLCGQDSTMRGVLEFDDDEERRVRLERHFETNAVIVAVEGERPWMMKAGARARLGESERYLASLERWLGFCDAEVFTAATRVQQTDVTQADPERLVSQLKSLITGSPGADYGRALADLRHQLDALRTPPGRTSPRLLEQKEQELRELEEAFQDGRALHQTVTSLRERQERLAQMLAARETALAQRRVQLERVRTVVERERELGKLEVEFEGLTTRMNQFVAAHERIERARIVREKVSAAEGVDLVTLLELEHAVRLAHQCLDIAREQAAQMPAWIQMGTWLIAALGSLAGITLALLVNWLLLAILLLVLVAGGMIAWRLGLFTQQRLERRTPAILRAEADLEEARARRARVLDRLGVSTVEETLTLRKTYEFSDRALDKAQAALLALGDEKQISQRYQQISVRLTSLRYRVADALRADDELRALGTPENRNTYREGLEEQVQALERSCAELRREQEAVEHELLEMSAEEPDLPVLFHRVRDLRHDADSIRQRCRALELAIGTLERTVREFGEQSLAPLIGHASNLLQSLTDGQYTRVTLSSDNLEPRVDTPSRIGIPPGQLSHEGQQKLYVTLRVALARALAGDKLLPLVLDDPYGPFDQERLDGTVRLMRSLAAHLQVVLFTCNPHYEEWVEPVLRLGHVPPSQDGDHRAIS